MPHPENAKPWMPDTAEAIARNETKSQDEPVRAKGKPATRSDCATEPSFVRQVWGNTGTPVTAAEAKDRRDRTNPSSDRVIVLQMR